MLCSRLLIENLRPTNEAVAQTVAQSSRMFIPPKEEEGEGPLPWSMWLSIIHGHIISSRYRSFEEILECCEGALRRTLKEDPPDEFEPVTSSKENGHGSCYR